MVELVLVYCLIGKPNQCVEQRPTFDQPLTAMSCMMSAQFTAADYVKVHPSWHLASWRCERNKPHEVPA